MVAVFAYVVAEVLELARNAATDNKEGRVIPRHIQMAMRKTTRSTTAFTDSTSPSLKAVRSGAAPLMSIFVACTPRADVSADGFEC